MYTKWEATSLPRAHTNRGISVHEGHQGIAASILVGFFLVDFFSLQVSLLLDHFHLPLSLEHCLIVHLFSLCMSSLPPMFTFVSRLLFLFNSPWFSLGFSVLLIFSSALPFSPLTFHPRVPLGPCFKLGLFCLVYWTFSLLSCTASTLFFFSFFIFLFFSFAGQKPGSYFFTVVGYINLHIVFPQEIE